MMEGEVKGSWRESGATDADTVKQFGRGADPRTRNAGAVS